MFLLDLMRCLVVFGLLLVGFAMILWEMATMTKPFEMMGREEFLREVVSFRRVANTC